MKGCSFSKLLTFLILLITWHYSLSLKADSAGEDSGVFNDCDLSLSQGICLYGGNTVVTGTPIIDNLITYLSFDDTALIDKSGNQNHASGKDKRGPGYLLSLGNSLHIPSENSITIKASTSLNDAFTNEYSVSFWIYISNYGPLSNEQCDVIAKGDSSYRSFMFTVDVATHSMMFASETVDSGPVVLTTNAKLLLQRWTHITLLRSSTLMMVYVNGNLDSVKEAKQGKQSANKDINIGRMPWQDTIGGGCSIDFFIDEFKIWNKVVDESYICADAGFALGSGTDPNSIELGCLSCDVKKNCRKVMNKCISCVHNCRIVWICF